MSTEEKRDLVALHLPAKDYGAFLAAAAERSRQDGKWGPQDHDFASWLEILMEEVGEACRARMELRYRPEHSPGARHQQAMRLRDELVQVAAVALAMVECGEREGWFDPA